MCTESVTKWIIIYNRSDNGEGKKPPAVPYMFLNWEADMCKNPGPAVGKTAFWSVLMAVFFAGELFRPTMRIWSRLSLSRSLPDSFVQLIAHVSRIENATYVAKIKQKEEGQICGIRNLQITSSKYNTLQSIYRERGGSPHG